MREDGFRAFLAASGYTRNSISSRLARCRSVERRLGVDLDALDLADAAFPGLGGRLAAVGRTGAVRASELNALRTYRRFRDGEPMAMPPPERLSAPLVARRRPAEVTGASVQALMRLYGDILAELKERGIARTANGPVGDYAEHLFATAQDWRLASNSERGHDAEDADGVRYQIKARRLSSSNASRQLSAIRQIDRQGFDMLAALLFDAEMQVIRAALIPFALVRERARFVALTNSWRVMLSDRLLALPGVENVTARLRQAAAYEH